MTEWMRGNELEQRVTNGDLGGTMRLAPTCHMVEDSRARNIYAGGNLGAASPPMRSISLSFDAGAWRGCAFRACRPTVSCRKSSRFPYHPWFVGVQFHPELKSKPFEPHPLFASMSRRR